MDEATSSARSKLARRARQLRRALEEMVGSFAYSIEGIEFKYQASMSFMDINVGSYVSLTLDTGQKFLGEVTKLEIIRTAGPAVETEVDSAALGMDRDEEEKVQITTRSEFRRLEGEGLLLGAITEEGFQPGAGEIFHDAAMAIASAEEIAMYFAAVRERNAVLQIGAASYAPAEMPVELDATGFKRHTFLCGQSGSGKTFSLGVVVEQLLLNTDLKLVIIDPNSDFIRVREILPLETINRFRTEAMTQEAYRALVERYQRAMEGVRVLRPASTGSDELLQLHLSDLEPQAQAMALSLDPLQDREEFSVFLETIASFGSSTYSIDDMQQTLMGSLSSEARNLALRIQNLGIINWEIWAHHGGQSPLSDVLQQDWRCLVLDVGSLALPVEKAVVAQAILSSHWQQRAEREPVLIITDEAHNIFPQQSEDGLTQMTTDLGILITGEGRKYGLYMLLASQRPSKIHANVLSQCENLVLMRMNSHSDLAHIQQIFSHVPASLLHSATQFSLGESLVAGGIIQHPTYVRFGGRVSHEGGGDVATDWAKARGNR